MYGDVPDIVCVYLWTGWWLSWLALAFYSKKTVEHESFGSRLTYSLLGVAGGLVMFLHLNLGPVLMADIFPHRTWVAWAGVAVTASGFLITYWARFTLGRNWSSNVTIKENHELIRTGPYRFVRHPIYTGILVALIGTAITRDEYRGILATLLLWLSFTIKRLREEEFMRKTFGARYDDYARTTGAIFPLVLRRSQ